MLTPTMSKDKVKILSHAASRGDVYRQCSKKILELLSKRAISLPRESTLDHKVKRNVSTRGFWLTRSPGKSCNTDPNIGHVQSLIASCQVANGTYWRTALWGKGRWDGRNELALCSVLCARLSEGRKGSRLDFGLQVLTYTYTKQRTGCAFSKKKSKTRSFSYPPTSDLWQFDFIGLQYSVTITLTMSAV